MDKKTKECIKIEEFKEEKAFMTKMYEGLKKTIVNRHKKIIDDKIKELFPDMEDDSKYEEEQKRIASKEQSLEDKKASLERKEQSLDDKKAQLEKNNEEYRIIVKAADRRIEKVRMVIKDIVEKELSEMSFKLEDYEIILKVKKNEPRYTQSINRHDRKVFKKIRP
mgnify:CR=1 FL=1